MTDNSSSSTTPIIVNNQKHVDHHRSLLLDSQMVVKKNNSNALAQSTSTAATLTSSFLLSARERFQGGNYNGASAAARAALRLSDALVSTTVKNGHDENKNNNDSTKENNNHQQQFPSESARSSILISGGGSGGQISRITTRGAVQEFKIGSECENNNKSSINHDNKKNQQHQNNAAPSSPSSSSPTILREMHPLISSYLHPTDTGPINARLQFYNQQQHLMNKVLVFPKKNKHDDDANSRIRQREEEDGDDTKKRNQDQLGLGQGVHRHQDDDNEDEEERMMKTLPKVVADRSLMERARDRGFALAAKMKKRNHPTNIVQLPDFTAVTASSNQNQNQNQDNNTNNTSSSSRPHVPPPPPSSALSNNNNGTKKPPLPSTTTTTMPLAQVKMEKEDHAFTTSSSSGVDTNKTMMTVQRQQQQQHRNPNNLHIPEVNLSAPIGGGFTAGRIPNPNTINNTKKQSSFRQQALSSSSSAFSNNNINNSNSNNAAAPVSPIENTNTSANVTIHGNYNNNNMMMNSNNNTNNNNNIRIGTIPNQQHSTTFNTARTQLHQDAASGRPGAVVAENELKNSSQQQTRRLGGVSGLNPGGGYRGAGLTRSAVAGFNAPRPLMNNNNNPGYNNNINNGDYSSNNLPYQQNQMQNNNNNNGMMNRVLGSITGDPSKAVKDGPVGNDAAGEKKKKKKKSSDDSGSDNDDLFPQDLLDENGEIPEDLAKLDTNLIIKIHNEILVKGTGTSWDDIIGLDHAKDSVEEAVIWPLQHPEMFSGIRDRPRGLLLFGPPGTGKTMVARALANSAGCTFFSISSSILCSKWIGEGEKLVRCLFAVAAAKAPAVIFIDEVDSLLTSRTEGEQDAMRRMKTEFLVSMDGVGSDRDKLVLMIGATNRPQELDEAARRRMEKRLYIPLPNLDARCGMLKKHFGTVQSELSEEDIRKVAKQLKLCSGDDVQKFCKSVASIPLREFMRDPANRKLLAAKESKIDPTLVRAVTLKDCLDQLNKGAASSVLEKELNHYREWNDKFGSFKDIEGKGSDDDDVETDNNQVEK